MSFRNNGVELEGFPNNWSSPLVYPSTILLQPWRLLPQHWMAAGDKLPCRPDKASFALMFMNSRAIFTHLLFVSWWASLGGSNVMSWVCNLNANSLYLVWFVNVNFRKSKRHNLTSRSPSFSFAASSRHQSIKPSRSKLHE